MLHFSSGEEATDEKMCILFFLVCQDCNNWVVWEGRTCALTKT